MDYDEQYHLARETAELRRAERARSRPARLAHEELARLHRSAATQSEAKIYVVLENG